MGPWQTRTALRLGLLKRGKTANIPELMPRGEFGPPPWVIERHRRAAELGLPGPPAGSH